MYKHSGIVPRLPRQHLSPRLLPSICFEQDGKLIEPYTETGDREVGTVKFICSRGKKHNRWDYLEITLPNGTVVPAMRRTSPENNFCVSQNFSFKIAKP